MTRKKEIVITDEEKQTDDSNKTNKKSFVRVSGQSKQKLKNNNIKTNLNSKSKKTDLLDAEVLDEDDYTEESSKERQDIIDIDNYKDSETEVILDDSDILPALREEESDEDDDVDLDDTIEIGAKENGLITTNALQKYLAELRKYSLMTREQEKEVAIKAYEEHDIESRNRLVTSNLRLVVKIAMEYRRAYSQILDLIQEGNAGLVQAVNRFNPYRGVKLSTYSAWWIRAYILKFLMDNKSLVRMGTTDAQRKLFFRLRGEAEKLYALTQKFDANLLAEKIGVQPQDVVEMQQRLTKNDVSLDTPVGEDNDTRQVDLLFSDSEEADVTYEKEQLLKILRKEVSFIEKELNERDAYIFHNRIMSDDPITLQDVGDKYGITRERARQLEARVIKKIKDRIIAAGINR
ncbi:sigma-70 family RNA polymerase sigma factor [Silvanigrella paludirubra]|uniref:RNA polymerase sigma factor n=1 Tax=Silvanigrella paludirubra TaxID=2499159 RepID=A0A6N6VRR5_9BACT|nr:RNA polymerase factor sigma-32 [Silvanigrella paludirubra]KAB8038802.1 sigma-70 family RNA polymerase sigma factor [Silvanigrella paludirubra]